ncbi:MAG: hypothetical protein ABDH21_00730 [bacterium]
MKILALTKLVIDPDIPSTKFKIDPETKIQLGEDNPIVISSYDENALEVALKLKDKHNFEVTVMTLTHLDYSQPIKKALAMGADKAIILQTNQKFMDSQSIAYLLSKKIREDSYNLILMGYESADWGHRSLAPLLSSILNYHLITYAYTVSYQNEWIIHKLTETGYITLKTNKNLIVSITTHQENQPRYPKVKDIMLASKKPIIIEKIEETPPPSINIKSFQQPQTQIECQIIQGQNSLEKAQKLYQKLVELKLIT